MEKFLRFYQASCHYGIDLSELEKQVAENSMSVSARLPVEITREEFYRDLYLPRPQLEKRIRKAVPQTRLLCVVGPKGSGKTTVIGKVVQDLRTKGTKKFIVEMDVRKIYSDPKFRDQLLPKLKEDPKAIIRFMDKRVSESYNQKLFSPISPKIDGKSPRTSLYEFVLTQEGYDYTTFQKPRNAILDIFAQQNRDKGTSDLYQWLENNRVTDDRIREALAEIDECLDHRHYIDAARYICGYQTQIVWYDNIDGLAGKVQLEMFHHLRRAHAGLAGYAMSIMAIRFESVKSYILSEEKAPPYADFVILHEDERSDAIALGRLSGRNIQRIVESRFNYSARRQQERAKRLRELIASSTEEEESRRHQDELNEIVPLVSNPNLKLLRSMSLILLRQLDRQKAFGLSNGSLRELLVLHAETLDQYRRVQEIMGEGALVAEDWYLSTLLLRWLRRSQRIYVVGIYELVTRVEEWIASFEQNRDQDSVACVLEHVIATGLWNLQRYKAIGGIPKNPPSVGSLVSRLETIGYERSDILASIFELYTHADSTGNVVDFCSDSLILDAKDISDTDHLFLTERGKCLTGRTCNTFGFLYESIAMVREGLSFRDGEKRTVLPLEIHTEIAADLVLDFLCDLALMYAMGMRQIRARLVDAGFEKSWRKTYRLWFGIPRFPGEKDFISQGVDGEKAARIDRALHFEALTGSIRAHFSYREKQKLPTYARKIVQLRRTFRNYVLKLDSQPQLMPPDFRSALGVGQRKWNHRQGEIQ